MLTLYFQSNIEDRTQRKTQRSGNNGKKQQELEHRALDCGLINGTLITKEHGCGPAGFCSGEFTDNPHFFCDFTCFVLELLQVSGTFILPPPGKKTTENNNQNFIIFSNGKKIVDWCLLEV